MARLARIALAMTAALLVAAAPSTQQQAAGPNDSVGSSETKTVNRSCGAAKDTHYDPPEGKGLAACKTNGKHDPKKKYKATHYTNEVTCGSSNALAPEAAGVTVSGKQSGTAGGAVQVCSDGQLPIHGRATAEGAVPTNGNVVGTISIDGDNSNSNDTAKGWARVDFSRSGAAVRCGKSYADGGRADAGNPTSSDNQSECG